MKSQLLALALACACNSVQAVEVTATGYGGSSDEALQNAKVLATEYAASTFVTGKQELIDGKYKETLGQYNGGFIRHIDVKSIEVNAGIYKVTILVDVNTDKINTVVEDQKTATLDKNIVAKVMQSVDEIDSTKKAWEALNSASDPFVITLDNSEYSVDDNNAYHQKYVNITYHFYATWNPKWIDDAKHLVKTINRPTFGTDINNPSTPICFGNNEWCGGVMVLPDTDTWKVTYFMVTIQHSIRETETRIAVANPAAGLFHEGYSSIPTGDNWYSRNVREYALSLYEKSFSRFEIRASMSVDEFQSIAKVDFKPIWSKAESDRFKDLNPRNLF